MRAAAVALVVLSGCVCVPLSDELESNTARTVDVQWPPRPPNTPWDGGVAPRPRACVISAFVHDAGACVQDGGAFFFDGATCRAACDVPVAPSALYEDESSCLTACLCGQDVVSPELLTPDTRCDYLRVYGRSDAGPPDAGQRCSPLIDHRFACQLAWPGDPRPDPSTAMGRPLGIAGVREACSWASRPDVYAVICEIFLE